MSEQVEGPREEVAGSTYILKFGTFMVTSAAVITTALICFTYLVSHSPESLEQFLTWWYDTRGGQKP